MTAAIQLPPILIRNSFNILGLSSSSALKEIRKRSQQLLQLAKIEEIQEFEIDIGPVKEFRNEGEIRLALERISGIQERLKEIFFWFEDHSVASHKAIKLISKGSYQQALAIFEEAKNSNANWIDKKNLALALMLYAFTSSNMDSFCRSLNLWKLLAETDDFWKFYEKHYLLHDELGTSPSLFGEFKNSLFETVSAQAVSFYHQTKNLKILSIWYSLFRNIEKSIDTEIIQPIARNILSTAQDFEQNINNINSKQIKEIIKTIESLTSELDHLCIHNYTPLVILFDEVADKLESAAISLNNKSENYELALFVIKKSKDLAKSAQTKQEIYKSYNIIFENSISTNNNKNTETTLPTEEAKGNNFPVWVIIIIAKLLFFAVYKNL